MRLMLLLSCISGIRTSLTCFDCSNLSFMLDNNWATPKIFAHFKKGQKQAFLYFLPSFSLNLWYTLYTYKCLEVFERKPIYATFHVGTQWESHFSSSPFLFSRKKTFIFILQCHENFQFCWQILQYFWTECMHRCKVMCSLIFF